MHKPLQSNAGPAGARYLPSHDENLSARGCLRKREASGQLWAAAKHFHPSDFTSVWLVSKTVQCYKSYDALYSAGCLFFLQSKLVLTSSILSAGTPGTLYRPQHRYSQQRTQRVPEAIQCYLEHLILK